MTLIGDLRRQVEDLEKALTDAELHANHWRVQCDSVQEGAADLRRLLRQAQLAPNLHLASDRDLMDEMQRRLDARSERWHVV